MPYRIAVQICSCRNLLGLAALSSLFLPGGCVDVCAGSAAIPIVEPSDSGICGENFEDFSTFRQVLANGCMLCDSRALCVRLVLIHVLVSGQRLVRLGRLLRWTPPRFC